MRKPEMDERFWYALLAIGTYVEVDALKNRRSNGTLSYATRKAMRCQTVAGKATFTVLWCTLSAWLIPHIVRTVDAAAETYSDWASMGPMDCG
jgi:hypothetical protein